MNEKSRQEMLELAARYPSPEIGDAVDMATADSKGLVGCGVFIIGATTLAIVEKIGPQAIQTLQSIVSGGLPK